MAVRPSKQAIRSPWDYPKELISDQPCPHCMQPISLEQRIKIQQKNWQVIKGKKMSIRIQIGKSLCDSCSNGARRIEKYGSKTCGFCYEESKRSTLGLEVFVCIPTKEWEPKWQRRIKLNE